MRLRRHLRNTLAFLAAALALWAGAAQLALGPLVHGVAILATGLALIRLAGLLVFRAALPAAGVHAPRILEEVVLLLAYAAWGLVRLRVAGMDLASLVTTSAVITAVVAFAMQDTLGNVLSGLFLELDRSLQIGDWVKLDDLSGRVVQIRWRHTAIRTRDGELAIVPNSALMKARFLVLGNPERGEVRWRRWAWFDVDYDVPAPRVIAAAEGALSGAEVPGVAHEPKPDCALMELAGGQARYALRYWVADPAHEAASAVRVHLLAALEREGIALSLPKQVSHQVKETEERQERLRGREIERRAEALRGVQIFGALTEAERRKLAARLVHAPFAAGDLITRQGAVAHWLYLLSAGEADVWVEAPGAPRRRVARLGAGSVFGEMGMMTGEPRRATVAARTDVECYRLDKEAFAAILRERPEIAEDVSRVLAARAAELSQLADESRAQAAAHPGTLLERIRTFFGLGAAAPQPLATRKALP